MLTTMRDWKLWNRLTEPYCQHFQQLLENRKKREIRLLVEGWNAQTSMEEDDCCSLGSFNTGFSCGTNDIRINSCPHFKERAKQRKVTLREQQLCLKYGQKSFVGLRTTFQLGTIKIVQTGSAQHDCAVTVMRVDPDLYAKSGPRERWIPGEKLSGLVCEIDLTRNSGFIETHKGKIFFFVPSRLSPELETGSVVMFEVVVRDLDGRVRAAKIKVLHDTVANDDLDEEAPMAKVSNVANDDLDEEAPMAKVSSWLQSQEGAWQYETTLPESLDEGGALKQGDDFFWLFSCFLFLLIVGPGAEDDYQLSAQYEELELESEMVFRTCSLVCSKLLCLVI